MFRCLVETVNEIIWSVDEDFTVQYISPQVTTILGYLPEQLTVVDNIPSLILAADVRSGKLYK